MNTLTSISDTHPYSSSVNWNRIEDPSKTDAAIPTRVETSRQQALQAIYSASMERIYSFVLFKVGSHERAEDITSEVFIKAAQFLDVTQSEKARLSWLYQVARTTITDHWRVFYKQPASSLEQLEATGQFQVADQAYLLTAIPDEDFSVSARKLNLVLSQLPDKYRRVLELRYLHGYSLKETAEAMGVTQGNVKVLQHRAINKASQTGALLI